MLCDVAALPSASSPPADIHAFGKQGPRAISFFSKLRSTTFDGHCSTSPARRFCTSHRPPVSLQRAPSCTLFPPVSFHHRHPRDHGQHRHKPRGGTPCWVSDALHFGSVHSAAAGRGQKPGVGSFTFDTSTEHTNILARLVLVAPLTHRRVTRSSQQH